MSWSLNIVGAIGTIDDLIGKNEEILDKFQAVLNKKFESISISLPTVKLSELITRTGKPMKNNEWVNDVVIDLSTMHSNKIFINDFSKGSDFKTNIKSIEPFDLLYGSIRPYFRKAGFNIKNKFCAGSVFSFKPKQSLDFLWLLALISSNKFHLFTETNSQGTKMPIISWNSFVSYKAKYSKEASLSLSNQYEALFKYIVIKMLEVHKLKKIKESLLKKYFS